jgi:hypothetical protein
MKKLVGVLAVAAMALTGCGNTCDDLDDAFDKALEKAKPCSDGSSGTGFNMNQCNNSLDNCSSEEKKALGDFADCLRDLPTCVPGSEDNFTNALFGCALTASGKVSDQCGNTIFGE